MINNEIVTNDSDKECVDHEKKIRKAEKATKNDPFLTQHEDDYHISKSIAHLNKNAIDIALIS
jgi:hypothetical protein